MTDRSTRNRELAELVDYSWKRCESRYHYEHGGWRISSSCARCGLTGYLPPNFHTWSGIQPVLEWLHIQARASLDAQKLLAVLAGWFHRLHWPALDDWAAKAAETIWTECCGKGDPT